MFIKTETSLVSGSQAGCKDEFAAVNEAAVLELDELVTESGIEPMTDFYPDAGGAMEIVVEMNLDWHALETDMMALEHMALVKEDSMIFEGALGDFWAKVKAFFINVWNAIKNFVAVVIDKLTAGLRNAENWYSKNSSKITVASIKITAYPGIDQDEQIAKQLQEAMNLAQKISASDPEAIQDTYNLINRAIETLKDSNAAMREAGLDERKEITISKAAIDKTLKGSNFRLAVIKNYGAVVARVVQSGIKIAEAGAASSATDATGQLALKAGIGAVKAIISDLKRAGSILIRVEQMKTAEAFRVARAMLKASGGKTEAPAA
jgi:hypothetical protein